MYTVFHLGCSELQLASPQGHILLTPTQLMAASPSSSCTLLPPCGPSLTLSPQNLTPTYVPFAQLVAQ